MKSTNLSQKTRIVLLNTVSLAIILIFVVVVTLFSFAQKSNQYLQYGNKLSATVEKKEFPIITETNGIVESTAVTVGDRISKGQSLFQLSNSLLDRQIALMESFSKDNNSAQLQLVELKLEKTAQTVYSPIEGTVESIPAEGESVNKADRVGYILSENNVKIVTNLSQNDYRRLQTNITNLSLLKRSTGEQYPLKYDGLQNSKRDAPTIDPTQPLSAVLSFSKASDASNFLQKEQADIVLFTSSSTIPKPIEWLLSRLGIQNK